MPTLTSRVLLLLLPLARTTLAQQNTTYDYIVVGAGPAGLVVADRLSEAGKNVLLIERGGPSTADTGGTNTPPWPSKTNLTRFDIPGLFENMFSASNQYWWCDDIQPLAGCLVGGGTAVNGLMYWYPPDIEYATSNGWPSGWQSISSSITKLKSRLPSTDIPSTDGKRYLTQVFDVVKSLLDTQGYTGITINDSPNLKDRVYGHPGAHIQGGKRTGPMDTYLKSAKTRSNFKLLTYTKVLSVVRNGAQITGVQTNNTALGTKGIVSLTSTSGRVILSSGAFGTAKILFQSGIGPSDMLSMASNNPASSKYMPPSSQYMNLPVGMNVKDSPGVDLVFSHPSVDAYDNWTPVWTNPRTADANQYVSSQAGPFTAGSARTNFWRAYNGTDGKTRYIQGTARVGSWGSGNTQFTITMYIGTGLTSVGRIGIDSSLRGQIITKPWLTDPVEKTVLTNAINDLLSTYKQVPNLQLITPSSSTPIATHVANMVSTSNHWAGSTRIGTNATSSVVDANAKVWNTNNLFVVDAGIYPGAFVGNPTGSILTMAELAVTKILALP